MYNVIYIDAQGHAQLVPGFSGKNGMARRRTVRAFHETPQHVLWAATDGAGASSSSAPQCETSSRSSSGERPAVSVPR